MLPEPFMDHLRRARIVLFRAGFRPSPIAPAALIEPMSKCPIQLVECRTSKRPLPIAGEPFT